MARVFFIITWISRVCVSPKGHSLRSQRVGPVGEPIHFFWHGYFATKARITPLTGSSAMVLLLLLFFSPQARKVVRTSATVTPLGMQTRALPDLRAVETS